MYVFGEINKSSVTIENNVVNYSQDLSNTTEGVKSINIVSGSSVLSGSYWDSLNVLFYTSGSSVYSNEHKFGKPSSNLALKDKKGKQYLNKFHGYPSSSLIQIPQKYYDEKIKEGTFILTDTGNTNNNGNNPIIKDDGYGNLYSTNANNNFGTLVESGTSISSSDNYVGNIFYNHGIAIITETGSWSGSVKYSDITKGTDFTLEFDSFSRIITHEYDVTLSPQSFNCSMNYTLRSPLSGACSTMEEYTASLLSTPWLASDFTSSDFQPYITTINLYQKDDYDTPVIQATLPRPIRKSDKIATTFKIKLDM